MIPAGLGVGQNTAFEYLQNFYLMKCHAASCSGVHTPLSIILGGCIYVREQRKWQGRSKQSEWKKA